MNITIKKFLGDYDKNDIINEDFDYSFSQSSSKPDFYKEYKKFLAIYYAFFFDKTGLKTIINNYDISLTEDSLHQIIKLYKYANKKRINEKYIIGEFLISYYNSVNNSEYGKSYGKSKVNEFKTIEKKENNGKSLYSELVSIAYAFYSKLVSFIIENDEHFGDEIANRLKINLRNEEEKYNYLINKLVIAKKNICLIIDFDNELSKHSKIYNDYIIEEFASYFVLQYPMNIIRKLGQKRLLKRKTKKAIINDVISKVNSFYNKCLNDEFRIINDISSIEVLVKQINEICNIIQLTKNEKIRLNDCQNNLMSIKRFALSDGKKIINSMHEFKYETKIPENKIRNICKKISGDCRLLYAISKENFEHDMKESLKLYSKHPLGYITNNLTLDSRLQMYYVFNKNKITSVFKDYYDKIGQEYTIKNQNKLVNKLGSDYYEHLLKYIRGTFIWHQQFLIEMLCRNNIFDSLIFDLKKTFNIMVDNDYSLVAHNVLEIETMIKDLAKLNGLNFDGDIPNVLDKLARNYIDNDTAFNGLMYINYILYEESGLKIRNGIAHGDLIKKDLSIEIVVTFSAMILLLWMENEKRTH